MIVKELKKHGIAVFESTVSMLLKKHKNGQGDQPINDQPGGGTIEPVYVHHGK